MHSQPSLKHLQALPSNVKIWVEVSNAKPALHTEHTNTNNHSEVQYTSVIGQVCLHTAKSNVPILQVAWQIQGIQNTVKNYTTTTALGQPTFLTQWDLTQNPIQFCWWRPGTYIVTCTISTAYGIGQVSNTFVVTSPLVRDFNAWTGIVGVGLYHHTRMIRFAYSMNDFQIDGIYMNGIIAGQQSVDGYIAGIQLACNQRFCTADNSMNYRYDTNGTYILDTGMTNTVFYQNHVVQLTNNGTNINYEVNDGPGAELDSNLIRAMFIGNGDVSPHIPETYRMYIMFCPDVVGGIWVPLKVMQWGWEGYTTYNTSTQSWGQAEDTDVPEPIVSDPVDFPVWSMNTSQSHWVNY
ncbi:MAG: hypothetical protein HYZ54_10895 [Ignavibacteriae bacterium]|nr:hypothetical protein [Ignavibacteriota bacterium]